MENNFSLQSAFPTGDQNNVQPEYGLSKREIFTMAAMQGIAARSDYSGVSRNIFATEAVKFADATIDALNAKEELIAVSPDLLGALKRLIVAAKPHCAVGSQLNMRVKEAEQIISNI